MSEDNKLTRKITLKEFEEIMEKRGRKTEPNASESTPVEKKSTKEKTFMQFEDMVYYIIHVMENPESYEGDVKLRAADLLRVIINDNLAMMRDGDKAELMSAGYKTLHAIDPSMN